MLAVVLCQTCHLQARFSNSDGDQQLLQFDSAQFRAQCKTACHSRTYECPDLIKAIKSAVWQTGETSADQAT
jgi:hypothetical protein